MAPPTAPTRDDPADPDAGELMRMAVARLRSAQPCEPEREGEEHGEGKIDDQGAGRTLSMPAAPRPSRTTTAPAMPASAHSIQDGKYDPKMV